MKTIQINNFVGINPIKLSACNNPAIGNLISIMQDSGSISFQHSMTPEQARQMASALVEMADSFEEVTA